MNRYEEIDKFLKEHAETELDAEAIYHDLMRYGHDRLSYTGYVDMLAYSEYENLMLNYRRDCLHISSNNTKNKHIKLYLNPTEEIDYKNLKSIIKYLDENKIENSSKLYTKTRSDSFTVRIDDIDSAIGLIDFINSNYSETESFLPTNPFVYREGIVGISYDDSLSYNYIVANIINKYLSDRVDNKSQIGIKDFNNYIKEQISKYEMFLMTEDKSILENDFIYKSINDNFSNDKNCVENITEVLTILSISTDETKGMNDILTCISEYQNKKGEEISKQDVLDLYIRTSIEKYGLEGAIKYLDTFVTRNDYTLITGQNGCRNLFIDNITPNDVLELTNNNIKGYYENYTVKNAKKK